MLKKWAQDDHHLKTPERLPVSSACSLRNACRHQCQTSAPPADKPGSAWGPSAGYCPLREERESIWQYASLYKNILQPTSTALPALSNFDLIDNTFSVQNAAPLFFLLPLHRSQEISVTSSLPMQGYKSIASFLVLAAHFARASAYDLTHAKVSVSLYTFACKCKTQNLHPSFQNSCTCMRCL